MFLQHGTRFGLIVWTAALLGLLLGWSIIGHARPVDAQALGCDVGPASMAIDPEEQAALDLINSMRSDARLGTLTISLTLTRAAAWKSAHMASSGSWGHDDPGRSWVQRIRDCGARSPMISENLAMGVASGGEAVRMWRDSAGHNRNMMDPAVRYIGISRERVNGAWYWTAVFATTADATDPMPAAGTASSASPSPRAPVVLGAAATVVAGRGDCLNLRTAPSTSAMIIVCLADGTRVSVTSGPREADGQTWWQIDGRGWASGDFLSGQPRP